MTSRHKTSTHPATGLSTPVAFFTEADGMKLTRYPCIFSFLFQPTTAHAALDGTKRRTPTLDDGLDTQPEMDPFLQLSVHDQRPPFFTPAVLGLFLVRTIIYPFR